LAEFISPGTTPSNPTYDLDLRLSYGKTIEVSVTPTVVPEPVSFPLLIGAGAWILFFARPNRRALRHEQLALPARAFFQVS
jgi:hypothetical protein